MQRVCVGNRVGGCFVFAGAEIDQDELICQLEGAISAEPSRYSIQLGFSEHLAPLGDVATAMSGGPSPWVFLNHCCSPNAAIRGPFLFAIRPIHEGDEITFDYETTEVEMAEPFRCLCGSPNCRQVIRGFQFLDDAVKTRLQPLLAPHLAIQIAPTDARATS